MSSKSGNREGREGWMFLRQKTVQSGTQAGFIQRRMQRKY